MIPPMIAKISIVENGKKRFRLWLPFFLLWPPLFALLLVLSPLLLLVSLAVWVFYPRLNPVKLMAGSYELVCASLGLIVEIYDSKSQINILIR